MQFQLQHLFDAKRRVQPSLTPPVACINPLAYSDEWDSLRTFIDYLTTINIVPYPRIEANYSAGTMYSLEISS